MYSLYKLYIDIVRENLISKVRILQMQLLSILSATSEICLIVITSLLLGGEANHKFADNVNLDVSAHPYIFLSIVIVTGLLRIYLNRLIIHAGFDLGLSYNERNIRQLLIRGIQEVQEISEASFLARSNFKTDNLIFNLFIPGFQVVSHMTTAILMSSLVLYVFGFNVILFVGLIVVFYKTIDILTKRKYSKNLNDIDLYADSVMNSVKNIYGSIRSILLSNSMERLEEYLVADKFVRKCQASNLVLLSYPKYFIETVLYAAILIYSLSVDSNRLDISFLILGFASIRLLPTFNQLFVSISSISRTYDIYTKNKIPNKDHDERVEISDIFPITINHIKFSYTDNSLLNIRDIKINRGDKVCLVGRSGVGKTTFIDILSGLIIPNVLDATVGIKKVDDFSVLSNCIEYLEQKVHIPEISISKYLDLDKYQNIQKIVHIAHQLGIEFVFDDIDKVIGPSGIKLSGGQKQRLALLKALTSEREILILDEPTSALDTDSTIIIGSIIHNTDKTVIVVTHSNDMRALFDHVITLE